MNTQDEAPVLLIVFNRPDTTKQVLENIRRAKPKKLYVSADAPRPNNGDDFVNCKKAREIVKQVDWDCEVQYRFLPCVGYKLFHLCFALNTIPHGTTAGSPVDRHRSCNVGQLFSEFLLDFQACPWLRCLTPEPRST